MRKSSGNRRFVIFCLSYYFFFRGSGGTLPTKVYPGSELYKTHLVIKEPNNFEIDTFLFRLVRKGP